MSASRISRADVEQRLRTVKSIGAHNGITVFTYYGSTLESLEIHASSGTYWLQAGRPGESGSEQIGQPRGLKEIDLYLQGMSAGYDAIRHTTQHRTD